MKLPSERETGFPIVFARSLIQYAIPLIAPIEIAIHPRRCNRLEPSPPPSNYVGWNTSLSCNRPRQSSDDEVLSASDKAGARIKQISSVSRSALRCDPEDFSAATPRRLSYFRPATSGRAGTRSGAELFGAAGPARTVSRVRTGSDELRERGGRTAAFLGVI